MPGVHGMVSSLTRIHTRTHMRMYPRAHTHTCTHSLTHVQTAEHWRWGALSSGSDEVVDRLTRPGGEFYPRMQVGAGLWLGG